jgi:hypothetical protein
VCPELGIYRFGPVIHLGMISGMAPYATVDARRIQAFLTDLGSGAGLSGSPVFLPESGRVIGLHYAGAPGARIGAALPLDGVRIEQWIRVCELGWRGGPLDALSFSLGGDVTAGLPTPTSDA